MTEKEEFGSFLRKYVKSEEDIYYLEHSKEIRIKFYGSVRRFYKLKDTLNQKYDVLIEKNEGIFSLRAIHGEVNENISNFILAMEEKSKKSNRVLSERI
jgi:hypothetical protein